VWGYNRARSRYARPCGGRTVFIDEHAQMQYRHEIEHAPVMLAPAGEGLEKLKVYALMQYGSVIGARSR